MDLYSSKGELIPAIQESGCAVFPEKDGKLHVKHYLSFDFHVEEEAQNEGKMMAMEESSDFLRSKNHSEQDIIKFLKIYYGYKTEEDTNPSKICGFRELDEEDFS